MTNCTKSCETCNNNQRPSGCLGNHCGKCCSSGQKNGLSEWEIDFLNHLSELNYLPFIYIPGNTDDEKIKILSILYIDQHTQNIDQLIANSLSLHRLQKNQLIALDFLNELPKLYYEEFLCSNLLQDYYHDANFKFGSICLSENLK